MPNRSGVRGPPASYLAWGAWPDGRLVPDAPVAVAYARDISHRISEAAEGRTLSGLAEEAGLARSTLHDLMTGRTWPDIVTLAKLETVLRMRLWPDGPCT